MTHLEGVLTLVSPSGPWFRIQGRHLRDADSPRVGARLVLSPAEGVTLDLHLGTALWLRAGWYPRHLLCLPWGSQPPAPRSTHRCFGRWLPAHTLEHGRR